MIYYHYILCFSHSVCLCFQSGSQACDGFREQLDKLMRKAEQAEEVLKECDSVGSPELHVVQARMEKLKVEDLENNVIKDRQNNVFSSLKCIFFNNV